MPCQISVDIDGDQEAFCRVEIRKARKEHRCNECNGKILKGEEYEYVCGLWDGFFEVNKTCDACLEIRKKFMENYYFGGIWEELHECALELTIADLEGLSINAIAKLEEQMGAIWEEWCDAFEEERYEEYFDELI